MWEKYLEFITTAGPKRNGGSFLYNGNRSVRGPDGDIHSNKFQLEVLPIEEEHNLLLFYEESNEIDKVLLVFVSMNSISFR
jgi:hypothetical protein